MNDKSQKLSTNYRNPGIKREILNITEITEIIKIMEIMMNFQLITCTSQKSKDQRPSLEINPVYCVPVCVQLVCRIHLAHPIQIRSKSKNQIKSKYKS